MSSLRQGSLTDSRRDRISRKDPIRIPVPSRIDVKRVTASASTSFNRESFTEQNYAANLRPVTRRAGFGRGPVPGPAGVYQWQAFQSGEILTLLRKDLSPLVSSSCIS